MSFIYAGRLDELKGIRVLYQAWELMGQGAPELLICGTGPLKEWCESRAEGLNIKVLGYIASEEVRHLTARSDALILPTLLYEGFPMTIAEAFSVDTPVICPDQGNAGCLTEEGVTGWKYTPGSAAGLKEAVERCLRAGSSIRRNVMRVYRENYTPEANYRILSGIYREVQNADRTFSSERR